MAELIQLRRGTAANWTAADTLLAQGELGIELDTGRWKIGDGSSAWVALPYAGELPSTGTAGAPTTGTGRVDEVAIDTTGRLWVCTAGGNPGTWALPTEALVGALLATNNLSDLPSVTNARTNLGLGSAATHASTDFDAAGAAAAAAAASDPVGTSAAETARATAAEGQRWKTRGTWVTATVYAVNDVVDGPTGFTGGIYRCITAHTSGASFSGPGVNWETVRDANGTNVAVAVDGLIKQTSGSGGHQYTLAWQATGAADSGTRGLTLSRDGTGFPVGLTLESVKGSPTWDTITIDATTTDLVLAYSHAASADQFRIRDGGTEGPFIDIGSSVGHPGTAHRLHLISAPTDTLIANLAYYEIASGSSATDYVRGQSAGIENFSISKNGFAAFGMVYTGAITNGSLEVATAASIVGASVNPELLLKRTGDLSKGFLIDVTNAGVLRLRDNSRGQNVMFFDTNGNVALGALNAALATTAVDGFVSLPSMAGTPTGSPTSMGTAGVQVAMDTSTSKMWAHIGGAWKSVTFA